MKKDHEAAFLLAVANYRKAWARRWLKANGHWNYL